MEPEVVKTEEEITQATTAAPVVAPASTQASTQDRPQREFKKNSRRASPRREPRAKSEFDQKIISIRRVTRVVTGGRRFAFSVAVVVGDRKGRVGVGLGKAGDTPLAIDKAVRDAKKNMIKVLLTKNASIPHEVEAKFGSSRVIIMRAPGKGILSGSSVRTVLEFAGIKEVSSKIFSRIKNKINNARAAVKTLTSLINKKK
ncbi:MAG TPA: 30S ribosomal protein S5 [Candidatus Paceibacterota bacterium]